MDYYSNFIFQFIKQGIRIPCLSKREAFSKQITLNTIVQFEALFNESPNVTLGKLAKQYGVSILTISRYYSAYKELRKNERITKSELMSLNILEESNLELSMSDNTELVLPESLPMIETRACQAIPNLEQLKRELIELQEENNKLKWQNKTLLTYVEPLLKNTQAELGKHINSTALHIEALVERVNDNTKALLSSQGTAQETKELQTHIEMLIDTISQAHKELISKNDLHCILRALDNLEQKVSNCLSVMDYILMTYNLPEDHKDTIAKCARELSNAFKITKSKWEENF